MNNLKIIFLLTFSVLVLISSCYTSGTQFMRNENAKYYPSKYPCTPKITIKLDETELDEWELIGVCNSNMSASISNKNVAMEEIIKCTCEHGGDLVKITDSKEHIEYSEYGSNLSDEITAEIYRKK